MDATVEDRIAKLEREIAELRAELQRVRRDDLVCIVVFSGEWDKVFAALTIANGALALGNEVHVFCTFWGACILRSDRDGCGCRGVRKTWAQRVAGWFLPKRLEDLPLSRMNFLGLGRRLLRPLMRAGNVPDLPTLFEDARGMGAQFHVCDTSACLFGWEEGEIRTGEGCDRCGVSTFLELALRSKAVFFI